MHHSVLYAVASTLLATIPTLTAAAAVSSRTAPLGTAVCSADPICRSEAVKTLCDSAGLSLTHSKLIDAPVGESSGGSKSLSLASFGDYECAVALTCGAATVAGTEFAGGVVLNA